MQFFDKQFFFRARQSLQYYWWLSDDNRFEINPRESWASARLARNNTPKVRFADLIINGAVLLHSRVYYYDYFFLFKSSIFFFLLCFSWFFFSFCAHTQRVRAFIPTEFVSFRRFSFGRAARPDLVYLWSKRQSLEQSGDPCQIRRIFATIVILFCTVGLQYSNNLSKRPKWDIFGVRPSRLNKCLKHFATPINIISSINTRLISY